MKERIQKLLSSQGIASRRRVEMMIREKRIIVNGCPAQIGMLVDKNDKVFIDNLIVKFPKKEIPPRVIVYNKSEGEICTRNDPEKRTTVFEKLPNIKQGRWVVIGRLDVSTSGLLLFTNNGALANKIMHPSSGVDKEYLVRIRGKITQKKIDMLRKGVFLDDGFAKFNDIVFHPNDNPEKTNRWVYVTLMEGRNREVRRLWETQNIAVSRLKRVRYGCIFLPSGMRKSSFVELKNSELKDLVCMVNSPKT